MFKTLRSPILVQSLYHGFNRLLVMHGWKSFCFLKTRFKRFCLLHTGHTQDHEKRFCPYLYFFFLSLSLWNCKWHFLSKAIISVWHLYQLAPYHTETLNVYQTDSKEWIIEPDKRLHNSFVSHKHAIAVSASLPKKQNFFLPNVPCKTVLSPVTFTYQTANWIFC